MLLIIALSSGGRRRPAVGARATLVLSSIGSTLTKMPPFRRLGLQALAVVGAVLVSVDRVFLGVHHPSDMMAGMLLGGACAAIGA